MQKLVYLSNSRDYTEQGDINENKFFVRINELLDQGWTVSHLTPNEVSIFNNEKPECRETFVAFVLLEKPDEQK